MKPVISILLFFTAAIAMGQLTPFQLKTIDSLKQVVKTAPHDSVVIKALKVWDDIIFVSDPALDLSLNKKIVALSKKNLEKTLSPETKKFFQAAQATAYNNLGLIESDKSNFKQALIHFEYSLSVFQTLNDKKGMSNALSNIGRLLKDQGFLDKAMTYYTRSLKLVEETNDSTGIANILDGIGVIYSRLSDRKKAMEYFMRSLKLREEINNKWAKAFTLSNIGSEYSILGKFEQALDYYNQCLQLRESLGDNHGIAETLNNIGIIYAKKGDNLKAIETYKRALQMNTNMENMRAISYCLANIANCYTKLNQPDKAIAAGQKALRIAQQGHFTLEVQDAAHSLYNAYKKTAQYGKSLEMYKLAVQARDSLENERNRKEIIRQEYQYEYEKQTAIDSLKHAEEQKIKDAEIARQKVKADTQEAELKSKRAMQYILFGGLGLLLVFAFFVNNRFRTARKQKIIIEEKEREAQRQKKVIEQKQKEIIDSINYARRIQFALLPREKNMEKTIQKLKKVK